MKNKNFRVLFFIYYIGVINVYQIYRVESSDTLEQIARKFGTTIDRLREINGMGEIYPGGYILVPSSSNNTSSDIYEYYTVKQGDNIYAIARQYGVDYDTLLRLNGLKSDDYIYPNQQIMIPKSGSNVYVTKEIDTIQSLYNNYGSNWNEFLSKNKNIYVLPDQMIR